MTEHEGNGYLEPEIKQAWLDALESGDYKQDTCYLKTTKGFCCLGVLADVLIKKDPTLPFIWKQDDRDSYRYELLPVVITENDYSSSSYLSIEFCRIAGIGVLIRTPDYGQSDGGHQGRLGSINDSSDDFALSIEYIRNEL